MSRRRKLFMRAVRRHEKAKREYQWRWARVFDARNVTVRFFVGEEWVQLDGITDVAWSEI